MFQLSNEHAIERGSILIYVNVKTFIRKVHKDAKPSERPQFMNFNSCKTLYANQSKSSDHRKNTIEDSSMKRETLKHEKHSKRNWQ